MRAKPHAAIPMHNSCPVRYVQSTRYLPNVEFLPFDLHESCTHTRSLSLSLSLPATEDVGFPHGRLKWRRKEGVEGQGSVHSDARRINIHLRKPAICSRSPSTYLQWWWWWWVHAWKSVRARLVETGLFKRHCTPTFDVNPPFSIKYATMTPLFPPLFPLFPSTVFGLGSFGNRRIGGNALQVFETNLWVALDERRRWEKWMEIWNLKKKWG